MKKAIFDSLNSSTSNYSYDSTIAGKDTILHTTNLQSAYTAAIAVEQNQDNLRQITRDELKINHAMLTKVHEVNFSIADKTMKEHGMVPKRMC